MSQPKDEGMYNVVVIGAGTAGLVTAAGTAGLGGRVALIERHQMGGDCLNTGCVPSKALISSARVVQQIRDAPRWGLQPQEPQFRFEDVMERMRERRALIAPHDSQERFESLGVDVFRGQARFTSPHEVEVNGQRLRGRFFLIAAGSRAGIPPVSGLAEAQPFTNETIFELREKPRRLIVLGAGPIGCELGQAFARLGVQVMIVEKSARILEREHAGELLHELVLAMKANVGLKTIASTIHAYPSFSEAARKMGDAFQRSRLTRRAQRLFAWLYGWQRRTA